MGGDRCARIDLRLGDMLHAHEAIAAATHVYVASLLFDDKTMRKLATLLDAAPKIRNIATLTRFPEGALPTFVEDAAELTARMDWNSGNGSGNEVHVYRRCHSSSRQRK